MSVHLQFDISDISQPFHQRCSELATKRRIGILTKLLLKVKTVPLKAIGHSLAARPGIHPKSCVSCILQFENGPNVIILTCILQIFPYSDILLSACTL